MTTFKWKTPSWKEKGTGIIGFGEFKFQFCTVTMEESLKGQVCSKNILCELASRTVEDNEQCWEVQHSPSKWVILGLILSSFQDQAWCCGFAAEILPTFWAKIQGSLSLHHPTEQNQQGIQCSGITLLHTSAKAPSTWMARRLPWLHDSWWLLVWLLSFR